MFTARRAGWDPAGLEGNIFRVDRIADNNVKDWKGGIIVAVVFGILGILCLIYYGVIVIYSGAGTSFSAIWIILALKPIMSSTTTKIKAMAEKNVITATSSCTGILSQHLRKYGIQKILITERERLRRATLRAAMAEYGYLLPPDEEITIRVGILTSNFHELRAKGIARHVGIPNVSGISAKSDPVLFAHFCVRECFAILKDKFVGNM